MPSTQSSAPSSAIQAAMEATLASISLPPPPSASQKPTMPLGAPPVAAKVPAKEPSERLVFYLVEGARGVKQHQKVDYMRLDCKKVAEFSTKVELTVEVSRPHGTALVLWIIKSSYF